MKTQSSLIIPGKIHDWPWILIFQEARPPQPPRYFLTHGRNYDKYKTKTKTSNGTMKIIGHIQGKERAQKICRELNQNIQLKS